MNDTRGGRRERQSTATLKDTILGDLGKVNLNSTLRRDLKDLYDFYLDDEARAKVAGMGSFKRWIYTTFWMLKNLFLKMTPARRILFLIAVILGVQLNRPGYVAGAMVILLFILILELKDKLLAQDELEAGRAIQFALMPDRSPKIDGWDVWLFTRPANDVGGDLVDYLRIQEDRLGLALGDVAGKGLGAALLMARLQSTVRALAPSYDSMTEFGSYINHVFWRDAIRSSFASLMYLEIRPDSGNVRILNAGHFPAIVVRNSSLQELPRGGTALGVLRDSSYFEQQTTLDTGDLLVVYSDGVTEASSEEDAFYGLPRLMEMLPQLRDLTSEGAGERIIAAVDQFVGDAKPSDDISLLILRRLDSPQSH